MKTINPWNIGAMNKTLVSVAIFILLSLLSTETFAITCKAGLYPNFVVFYSRSVGGNVVACSNKTQTEINYGQPFGYDAITKVFDNVPSRGIQCHDIYGTPNTKCPQSYVFTPTGLQDSSGNPVTCGPSVCTN